MLISYEVVDAVELRQLAYFVAAAEEGQFTLAAARLYVAQPAASTQIRRLEHEVGEPLFHRESTGVRLTPAGETLLPHARAALAAIEAGRDAVASLRGLLHGQLRIGVSWPTDPRLTTALGVFHRAHPAVHIEVTEEHNQPLLTGVADGDIDAAIVGMTDQALPPQVRTRVIAAEPLVVGVAADHPMAGRTALQLADLRDVPMITLTRSSGLRAVLEDACHQAGFTPRITAEASEVNSLVDLTAQGLGVTILPRSAIPEARLRILQLARPALRRRTALAWNQDVTTPAGRAFLSLAEEELPPPRPDGGSAHVLAQRHHEAHLTVRRPPDEAGPADP